jgi:hypothetical protein
MAVSWNRRWRRSRRGALTVTAIGVLGLTVVVTTGNAAQTPTVAARTERHSSGGCRVPSLTGLTLKKARARAVRAGCAIRTEAVQVPGPQPQQRIVQQFPTGGRSARPISVWLAPRCPKPGPTAPLAREPFARAGPTELISGFFVVGGPATLPWTCPRVPEPQADTITVINPATSATVASETVGQGQLATIVLAPGTYTVEATPATPVSNLGPTSTGQTVTIPAGMTVRQDFFASVP